MKLYLVALVAIATLVSTASAAPGRSSTGSTSTGVTSTGTTITTPVSTGSTSTGVTSTGTTSTGITSTGTTLTGSTSTGVISTPTTSVSGGGGITRGFNTTTKQYDLVPQCFPWAWLLDFYKGSIFMIYENQRLCRVQRLIDFGM